MICCWKKVLVTLAISSLANISQAGEVTGAGSTFVYPILSKWAEAYKKQTGHSINYQSIGSGGGIKQIQSGTVDFGATDKPLTTAELQKDGLVQFPIVNGAVVPVVNLPSVGIGELKLSGQVLGDIFLGKIKKWNDPAIAALNKNLHLPATAVTVVHRADGSGTSFIVTNYLSKVNNEWQQKVGEGTSVSWPAGIGGKGNEGVAAYVQKVAGAIGYVEYAYAQQNKMNYASLQNSAGKFVKPEMKSFSAAAAGAKWDGAPNFNLILTNAPGNDAWPVAGSTFILMHKAPKNPAQSQIALGFFRSAFNKASADLARDLNYVPLTDNVVKLVENSWKDVQGPDGKPIAKK